MSSSSHLLRRQLLLALGSSGLLGPSAVKLLAACAEPDPPPPPTCPSGREPERTCFSRERMELATRTCGGLTNRPVTEPEPTVRESLIMDNGCLPKQFACNGCCSPAVEEGEPQPDGSCCYYHCPGACCGRPFIVAGAPRTAAVVTRSDWLAARAELAPAQLSARIAQQWLSDALLEHASVAAFARFTLELLAFGAPSQLVEDSLRAGLDEVSHARACFAEAARYDRTARGPGALAVHDVRAAATLAAAVRCTFVEGCIGETQAALIAREAARLAEDPTARALLTQIAEDEARHAELAWRFVAWALDTHPALASELEGALLEARARTMVVPEREPAETVAAFHAAGRLTEAERTAFAHEALGEVVTPCLRGLLSAAAYTPSAALSVT
jgi:hypothetical protein